MKLRLGIEVLLNSIEDLLKHLERTDIRTSRSFIHVVLPTGYGKSMASIIMLNEIFHGGLIDYAERVIHTVPTRCLVEDLVERARKLGVPAYGQCMFFDPSFKDPYFLMPLVFSTIDSYALNFFKVPVAEYEDIIKGKTLGHYDVPKYAMYTAINVFDEYHLLTPGDSGDSEKHYEAKALTCLFFIMKELLSIGTPVLLETATPRDNVLELFRKLGGFQQIDIIYDASVTAECTKEDSKFVLNDHEFTNALLNHIYITETIKGDFQAYVLKLCNETIANTLVVCNTIKEAVSTFDALKRKGFDPILLHSQFTIKDRKDKLRLAKERMRKGNAILISTQVIEVGVDLDFDVLITNSAPITSLVQRVGRIGRNIDRYGEYYIYVVYDDKFEEEDSYSYVYSLSLTRKTFEELKKRKENGILWRLSAMERVDGMYPYNLIAKNVYGQVRLNLNRDVANILKRILSPSTGAREAQRFIMQLRGLIREGVEIPILVNDHVDPDSELESIDIDSLLTAKPHTVGFRILPRGVKIDFEQACKNLKCKNKKLLAVIEAGPKDSLEAVLLNEENINSWFLRGYVKINGRKAFIRAFIANPEAYDPEKGFGL